MSRQFTILVEDLCRLLGQNSPPLEPDASGGMSVLLNAQDAWFELAYMPGLHPDRFLLETRLGPPPEDTDALLELLHANLDLLRTQESAFGWRSAANEIVYETLIPLQNCDATMLLELMTDLSGSVHEWKAEGLFTSHAGSWSEGKAPPGSLAAQSREAVIDLVCRVCEDERTLQAEPAEEESGESLIALLGFEDIDLRLIHPSPSADVVLLEFGFGPIPYFEEVDLLLRLMEVDGFGLLDNQLILAADLDEGQLFACRVCPVSALSPEGLLMEARLAGEQFDAWLAAAFPDLARGSLPYPHSVMPTPALLPSMA